MYIMSWLYNIYFKNEQNCPPEQKQNTTALIKERSISKSAVE